MKRRGFTLVELSVAMVIMGALLLGTMTVFSQAMQGYYKTKTDIDLATTNSLSIQRVAETLRSAYSMQVVDNGRKVVYTLPKFSSVTDPDTGEKELYEPLQSDGVQRSFSVANGQLVNDQSGRVLAKNVVLVDPDPQSSQYNQQYPPFQLTTIGSRRALTINLITQDQVLGEKRYVRMKSTVILRNSL
jgi:prepilin-type N-terminal cleavage/methylation domain-containing protein